MRLTEESPMSCCDFSCEGLRFSTGGFDCRIRVFDTGRSKPIVQYTEPGPTTPGHANRIYSLKYHSTEPFTLYSGGWDK
jgi:WD40 repeat protein